MQWICDWSGVHKIYSIYIPVIHAVMEEATEIRLITLSLKGMQTLEACTENEDMQRVCTVHIVWFVSASVCYVFSILKVPMSQNGTLHF